MFKALFEIAQSNKIKNTIIGIEVLSNVNSFFNKISSVKHEPSLKMFTFAMIY